MQVVVAHAGRQYSHRTAAALDASGWLIGYWSGLPIRGRWAGDASGLVSRERHVAAPWAPATRRILERLLPASARGWGDFLANRSFDSWAARKLRHTEADVVVGYEVGCARLFDQARRRGMSTVLDAAALHPDSQATWSDDRSDSRLKRRIREVKERELELSDFVLTASEFARATYVRAGFPADRVRAVRLGADVDRFRPGEGAKGNSARFCFVGSTLERKGVRELEAAMSTVLRKSPGVVLAVAGAILGPGADIQERGAPGWSFLGKLRGESLVDLYRNADALILPSLEDSFGMVVPESLACGTPAIVSDRTGASDLIQEGVNGWIVPAGDIEGLAGRMLWIAQNLEAVRKLRLACVTSALQATWQVYSRNLVETLGELISRRGAR